MSVTLWELANIDGTDLLTDHMLPFKMANIRIWETLNHIFASSRWLSKGNQQTNWILKMWNSSTFSRKWQNQRRSRTRKNWKARKMSKSEKFLWLFSLRDWRKSSNELTEYLAAYWTLYCTQKLDQKWYLWKVSSHLTAFPEGEQDEKKTQTLERSVEKEYFGVMN